MPAPAVATWSHVAPPPVARFDDFELDIQRFELRLRAAPVALEPQVFEVLSYLVHNADRVVTKEELFDRIWPDRYVSEAALNSRVMSARKAIGDSGQAQRYIKTVHGRGYRFVGDLKPVAPSSPREVAPVGPTSDPMPLRAAQSVPAVTVQPSTSFIGRGEELRRLDELLNRPRCRLISIVGPGGVGKTRLAIEAANRASMNGRPTVFVPLDAIAEAEEIPAALAAALGSPLRSDRPSAELLRNLASREEVIVLDNLEHLLDGGGRLLSEMLTAAPGITLVVTSRSVVGLAEEWVLPVSGLPVSGDGDESEATCLFLERAAQANAWTASPSIEERHQISEICRLVDGMPLAIELAASLCRYLTYSEIAVQISRDIAVLSADLRDTPSRQHSILVLLEESCQQLAPEELEALETVALFEGQFTATAAGAVADAPLALLRKLVDHSLVQPGRGSFSLHPLLRHFLLARLGERVGPIRERHARYYAEVAESVVAELEGAGQVQGARHVEDDLLNFASAWRWAADNGRVDLMDRMAYPLFLALTFRGRFFDSYELLQHGIPAARSAHEARRALLPTLLTSRAWVLFRFGRFADAASDVKEAVEIEMQSGLTPRPGIGLDPRLALAVLFHAQGEFENAYNTALAVLEQALASADPTTTAFASWIGGSARMRQARLVCEERPDGTHRYAPTDDRAVEEASRLVRAARAVLREMGDSWLSAFVEIELGLIAAATGDSESACDNFRQAYDLRRAFNDPQGMASARLYLADTLISVGRIAEADALHEEILRLAESIADSTSLAEVARRWRRQRSREATLCSLSSTPGSRSSAARL